MDNAENVQRILIEYANCFVFMRIYNQDADADKIQ